MSQPPPPRPDRYAPSEGTLRAWASRRRGRIAVAVALAILVASRVWSEGDFAWWPVLIGLGGVAVGLIGVKALARYRLAHLPPGALWAGSAALEVADLRTSSLLEQAAPRPGFWTDILLSYDLAPGLLVIEEAELRWSPGRLARWCGASPWTLRAEELVAAEVGRKSGPAAPVGLWLRMWLSDRSAISMQLVSRSGLDDALDRLGLGNRRVWPA